MFARVADRSRQARYAFPGAIVLLTIGALFLADRSGILNGEPEATPTAGIESVARIPTAAAPPTPTFAPTPPAPTRTESLPVNELAPTAPALPAGTVYLADAARGRIEIFNPDGTWIQGWGRDDQESAIFDTPAYVAASSGNDFYLLDATVNQVLRITTGGRVLDSWPVADSDGNVALDSAGIAIDAVDNIYVLDRAGARVWKFTPEGEYLFVWGQPGDTPGSFSAPASISAHGEIILVVDRDSTRIQRFDSYGRLLDAIDAAGYQITNFISVAALPEGGIAVSDKNSSEVLWIDRDGEIRARTALPSGVEIAKLHGAGNGDLYAVEANLGRVWLVSDENSPAVAIDDAGSFEDIAIAADGTIVLSHHESPALSLFDSSGNKLEYIRTAGSERGDLARPWGVAVSHEGRVYVSDVTTNRIQVFDSSGEFLFFWGGTGERDGQFRDPRGIFLTTGGHLYVADSGNHRIQIFDKEGNHISTWGGPDLRGFENGQFNEPHNVEVTPDGIVLVADTGNNRIQSFDKSGDFLDSWGHEGFENASFRRPVAVGMHRGEDRLYIADQGNQRIQLLHSNGSYIGQWNSRDSIVDIAVSDQNQLFVVAPDSGPNSPVRRFDIDGEFLIIRGEMDFASSELEQPVAIAIQPEER